MSAYWQAKIWGLLHDPALKALHNNTGRGENSFWEQLDVMQNWVDNKCNPETSGKKLLKHIHLADYIASASDRGAIGSVSGSVNYAPGNDRDFGLEISHLLSGKKLHLKLKQHDELIGNRKQYLNEKENELLQVIPEECRQDSQRLFWWLWRCLPEAVIKEFQDESLLLMPAETRLPDSSIWSHTSITAALAGALAGYDLTTEDITNKWSSDKTLSHPYLATFSFSPIQELIKASRKMRDFWAGSWILHYLSAVISWKLANLYGPDCLLYPSLFQQPLIDHWLTAQYPEFEHWVKKPSERQLLTAGFPNVIVLILPKDEVEKAMQTARQTLLETWYSLSDEVLGNLQKERHWMPQLSANSNTWKSWLNSQWQTYWSAVPIGVEGEEFKNAAIPEEQKENFEPWVNSQNQAYNLTNKKQKLFLEQELDFLREAYKKRLEKQGRKFSVNVGSWWPHIFDQTRLTLATVKNARNWKIPTAFGPRSTISGIGPVVHPGEDWITEGETQRYWKRDAGLFDGIEQLNATETVKRGLEKVLSQRLEIDSTNIATYPDLTAGVAGYLKVHQENEEIWRHFQNTCQAISNYGNWVNQVLDEMSNKWGIPWMDESEHDLFVHPRLLNAGWLVEDAQTPELKALQAEIEQTKNSDKLAQLKTKLTKIKQTYRLEIEEIINQHYPSNNPADWYIITAGDGDDMSEWLKGKKLKKYRYYTSKKLQLTQNISDEELLADETQQEEIETNFKTKTIKFLNVQKRMGPSTHSGLSRALLDFSNQLVPYLTEQRYAGRLIYGGGDDVLAYTNLWEWDSWLWDIRQCFRGDKDPKKEFDNEGDYWRWQGENMPDNLAKRPLFTMGENATISFGVVIAHHSVPLAISLENLWEAEDEAKKHKAPNNDKKDAVQVRVIYSNGNILKATTKFNTFEKWHQLLTTEGLESSLFETAATLWTQHPAPNHNALSAWTTVFCERRDFFANDDHKKEEFKAKFTHFMKELWNTTPEENLTDEIQYWLKLAAFVLRNRDIKLGGKP
ncbi:MAG: type III-B CRISPR-associated protein Cas10/Cmr2 [Limnoraphis sp.]